MPWRGPEYEGEVPSLGWALLDWLADFLPSPRDPASPFILTDEQATILVRWYSIHPVTGRFLFRRGCSRRSKGWGKSPLEAVKVIAELAGDMKFDGWDAAGEPVGRPWGTGGLPQAQIQVAAVSEDQTDNTWMAAHGLLNDNDGHAADALGIDAGLTRFFLRDRKGHAKPVTASAGAREGAPDTYAVLDETHLWTPRNGGTRLAATLRRNVAKMAGRSFETTNSYVPGEGSVAEGTHKAVEEGRGIFYDAVEAPTVVDGVEVTPEAPDEVLRKALDVAYGGSWWVDLDRLVQDIRDPDTKWEDSERFFFNWNRKGGGKAVDPKRWAELARPDRVIEDGAYIALGFDGSISEDATVLRGCTADGFSFIVKAWERPLGAEKWRVPRLDVHDAVAEAFERWTVGQMYYDPPKWWSEGEQWQARYGDERVIPLDTNKHVQRFAPAVDRWLTAIKEGTHTHDGDELTSRHVAAAHLKKVKATADDEDFRTLYVIVKGEDGRKIDAAVADILAFEAASTMRSDALVPRIYGWDDVEEA
jgi:hypothetical protein